MLSAPQGDGRMRQSSIAEVLPHLYCNIEPAFAQVYLRSAYLFSDKLRRMP